MGVFIGDNEKGKKVNKIYFGINSVSMEILKGYVGDNTGKAKLFYKNTSAFSYSGSYTDIEIVSGGIRYRLLTLLSSGFLKAPENTYGDIVLIGGGSGGAGGFFSLSHTAGAGGGGGYLVSANNQLITSGMVEIGAGGDGGYGTTASLAKGKPGGQSSIAGLNANGSIPPLYSTYGASGGSGGGASPYQPVGTGDKKNKVIFGDQMNFPLLPCAGGSGGAAAANTSNGTLSGSGGSNGSDGLAGDYSSFPLRPPQQAKDGGGIGGGLYSLSSMIPPVNASYYGGGGGGASKATNTPSQTSGSNGYQGVVFIRIPIGAA